MLKIKQLIKDAEQLVNRFGCQFTGHVWIAEGGRACPEELTHDCSQTVFICKHCGTYDYGEKDGPGWKDCQSRLYCPIEALDELELRN